MTLISAALLLAAAGSCISTPRPAPADAGAFWPMYMGNPARAPFLGQRVTDEAPSELWSASLSSGIRGMLVVTDEVIVAATTDRGIQTLSRQDGSTFWRRRLDGPPVSPLVVGDVIFTATEDKGRLRSLGLVEGENRWERRLPSVSTPVSFADDTVFVAAEDGSLAAFSRDDRPAEPLWLARFPRAPSAGPLILDRWAVYVAFDSVFVVNRHDGERRAAAHSPEIFAAEAASDGCAIYLTTERGSIVAWRLPDLEFLWQASGFQSFVAGPVLADFHGYAVTRSGQLIRFAVADGSAETIARVRGVVVAPPTVVQNGLLLGTLDGRLHFFDRDGRPVWDLELEGSIESPILVHEGRIVVPLYGRGGGALSSGLRGKVVELR